MHECQYVNEGLWIRGSICDHFWLSGLASGATRDPFLSKRFCFHKTSSSENDKNHQHIFPIKVLDNKRDLLKKFLEKKGIQTGIHYQPNHLLSKFRTPYKLTESEKFGKNYVW